MQRTSMTSAPAKFCKDCGNLATCSASDKDYSKEWYCFRCWSSHFSWWWS